MSATSLKLFSLPILAALLLAAALPFFLPHLTTPSLPTVPAADKNLVPLYSEVHTDSEHDPYLPGSTAEKIISSLVVGWPGGQGPDWKCFTIKIGEAIIRTVYWHRTSANVGDLAWFNHQTNQWGGAYDGKLEATAGNLPYNLQKVKGAKITGGCNDGAPPPLTPATP